MSNRSRLVLLSGPGGSGISTLAEATAAAAVDEGLRACLVDVTRAQQTDAVESLIADFGQALLGWVQADPPPTGVWAALPDIRAAAAWHAVLVASEAEDIDLVVVDLGSLREARALLTFLHTGERALAALLTPALAMSRTGTGGSDPGEGFAAVRAVRDVLARVARVIESDRTTLRMVTVPEAKAVTETAHELAVFAMLGVTVDAIVVNRCGRKSDGLPSALLDAQRVQLQRAEELAQGAWCWKSTSSVRAVPKDRSVLGPLGGVAVLRSGDLQPLVREEDYALLLPLVGDAAAQARVGRFGDQVVVEFDGVQRWLELPAILRRCHAVVADRTREGLLVSFVPDAAQWRAPDHGSAA